MKRIFSVFMLTILLTSMLTLASNNEQVKAEPTTIVPNDHKTTQQAADAGSPLSVAMCPDSASIDVTESALLSVAVRGGTPDYKFQWYLNDDPVSDATKKSWTFPPSPEGNYKVTVKVTDKAGATRTCTSTVRVARDWPMEGRTPNHMSADDVWLEPRLPDLKPIMAGPEVAWTYPTGSYMESSPSVVHNYVYLGGDREVYRWNATTGQKVWSQTVGGRVFGTPAVGYDRRLYVGCDDHKVYCLDADSGKHLWNYTTGDALYSSPVRVGDRVYVTSHDKNIYCLNAINGALIWSYTTGGALYNAPTVIGGRVYVGGTIEHKFYCLDATTGNQVWIRDTVSLARSSPTVDSGRIFTGWLDGYVRCMDATNGDTLWSFKTDNVVTSSPAVEGDYVWVGSWDTKIYCLKATTGELVWSYKSYGCMYSSPTVVCDRVYVGSDDGNFYCLNATDGSLIWNYTTAGGVNTSPAAANGVVYVGSDDGNLYAFGYTHDVADTDVISFKTVVGQGFSDNINATVANQGNYTENFNVTAYYSLTGYTQPPGLVGYWKLDEGSGTTAYDSSGHNNHGTIYGASWTNGKVNDALSFDGVDDYANCGADPSLMPTTAITVEAWIKASEVNAYATIASTVYYEGYELIITPSGYIEFFPGISYSDHAIQPDLWYHVAGTFDGTTSKIYVNGELWGSQGSGYLAYTGQSLWIGNAHATGAWFNGIIDELRIYNRALSQEEIVADMQGYSGTVGTETITLAGGSSTTVTFAWNTTGIAKGNYTISAYATPVPDETHIDDNLLVDGWVLVATPGDVNPDGIIDIFDCVVVALAFGSKTSDPTPPWDPVADINNDGEVDIFDLVVVALHFGEIG